MSDWKADLGNTFALSLEAQAGNCETEFLNGITQDMQEVAGVVLNRLLERGKKYIDCRFGGMTDPQAQAAWGDLSALIAQCGTANLSKLWTGGFQAYAQAVTQCVAAKLLGGVIGGGIGGIGGSPSGFQERAVSRCGG